jgi:hypothetical protein
MKMENHKEFLNEHKLHILRRMAEHVKQTGKNEVPLSILRDNISDYNNAQKCRYSALIFKIRRGTWGITSHGWAFLRGDKDLHKYVYVANNQIVARSNETINVRDLNRGEVVVHNQFEYYNEDKDFLNRRPASSGLQTSLV